MQYTLRNVPARLDEMLRRKAREEHKSINQVAVEALIRAFGLSEEPTRHRRLDDIAGTWEPDSTVDEALEEQRHIDSELWR